MPMASFEFDQGDYSQPPWLLQSLVSWPSDSTPESGLFIRLDDRGCPEQQPYG